MRLLVDTHVAIWMLDGSELSEATKVLIADPENAVFISMASIWEAHIKQSIGKLRLSPRFREGLAAADIVLLPIEWRHVESGVDLPLHHRDPLDRMLIAQARCEGLTIVTRDRCFQGYDVPVILA